MSFDKHSNFNKLANFSEVKFGENMPVLEVELNEMQQIQNEARADIIRDTMPSGFVTLGEIDYDHCASKDNQLKLKTESLAYVNGYRITIPANTIIEIGESDKVREDLVFLEVWKEVVTNESDLKEYGGEQNADIENPIKDERYPIATSQRVALKYRIRVIPDMDFSASWVHCSSVNHPYVGWTDDKQFSQVYAKGGNESLEAPKEVLGEEIFRSVTKTWNDVKAIADPGLWIAGLPEGNKRCTKERYKCIDGFVYAIPMFRLLRKPNVGLASPFEYKKIHNQLDPKKFAHLVGQENVEKVHSVEIAGRTYNNHTLNTKDMSLQGTGSFIGFHLQHSEVSKPLKTDTDYLFIINVKSNTLVGDDYSLDFGETDPNNSRQQSCFTSQFSLPLNALGFSTHILHTKNSFEGVYCVSRSQLSNSVKSGDIVFDYMIIEYSPELVDIDFIPYFEGVKSLGELTNNSITVENNLVKEGTYVHELQNHILITHPEVTHVTWGEDVVIPPEVEIELKNGEEVIQTITQLPVKLETTGEEKLHVKTMKGRTLVNLSPKRTYDFSCSGDETGKYTVNSGVNEITLTINENPNNWRYFKIPLNLDMLKPNTKYLVIFDGNFSGSFSIKENNASYPLGNESVHNSGKNSVVIETNDLSNGIRNQFLYLYPTTPSTFPYTYKVSNVMFIEYQEGMENWGLKYFGGMKSVEAPNIKVTGKNIFDNNFTVGSWWNGVADINPSNMRSVNLTPVKPNTTYTYNSTVSGHRQNANFLAHDINGNFIKYLGFCQTFTTPPNCHYIHIYTENDSTLYAQIEEGTISTPIEPYTSNSFRTPKGTVLRSLNSSLFDSIDFDSGFIEQNIGELMMNGSLEQGFWILNQQIASGYQYTWRADTIDLSSKTALVLCDSLVSSGNNESITNCIWAYGGTHIVVHSPINNLDTFKDSLKNKPLKVLYLKSSPITKKIEVSEDDYLGKSKVTYQLAEPLRKIDSYCDFILGNKLHSYIDKVVFNGSESWEVDANFISDTLNEFKINLGFSIKDSNLVICDRLLCTPKEDTERIYILLDGRVYIRMLKSEMTSVATFKQWLSENPLTVYFVRSNPVITPLKEVSPLVSPMPLNSYVGSLYVANGINQTKFLTDFSPSDYQVQTYHRYFSNEFNMFEDIKRKKSPYGHKTYLEEIDGKYVEKFIAGLEKHEIEDLRHKVSLTGFDYNQLLQDSFLKLIKGELS